MVVVVIIGLLAAIAIPAFTHIRLNAQNTRFYNDLRVFKDTLEIYLTEHETPPPDETPGDMPPDLAPYLTASADFTQTPIGGVWDYENWIGSGNAHVKIGMSVYRPKRTVEQMRALDGRFDDGSLSSGKLVESTGRVYTYVLIPPE